MHVERRTVSRKTSNDGRLEITKVAAAKLEALGSSFGVEIADSQTPAHLGTMQCTCRGADNPHVHYFLESNAFRDLTPGAEVDLDVDIPARVIRVTPAK